MEILEQGGEYIRQIRQKVRSGELKKTEGARLIFEKATNWRQEIRKEQQKRGATVTGQK